jgi:hypothetical protein
MITFCPFTKVAVLSCEGEIPYADRDNARRSSAAAGRQGRDHHAQSHESAQELGLRVGEPVRGRPLRGGYVRLSARPRPRQR